MRTSFIFLSAAVLLAACSNDAEPTAPLSRVAATNSGPAVQATNWVSSTGSKPFSKVTIVLSDVGDLDGVVITSLQLPANCPPGSVIVGGGYHVAGGSSTDARVLMSVPNGLTGWIVYVVTTTPTQFQTYAVCAQ
jgi:hypothetical protein